MNSKRFGLGILCFVFVNSISMAASPMEKFLSKLAILETKDGRSIKTFEDVNISLDPFQKRNKKYPIVNIDKIPEGYVSKETAQKYFKEFSQHAVVTDEDVSFEEFMNEHFSIEDITEFPNKYYGTKPGSYTFYLKMDDSYKFVSSFKEYEPDAVSCFTDTSFCGSECENKHKKKKNIYSDFKQNIISKAKIIDAEEVDNKKNCIKMSFVKRTPPAITNDGSIAEEYNGFPVLGGDISYEPCTSGDWYLTPNGILIGEPYPPVYYAKFSFGRFKECPKDGEDWKNYEEWSRMESIKKIDYESAKIKTNKGTFVAKPYFQDVIKFYEPLDGFIRYSIFAKEGASDDKSPTNPSIIVEEDKPETGYGYPTAGDLGNTPETAKDWPDRRPLGEISGKCYIDGRLRIYDNDKPNIIIRVTNVETNEQMFFPPCVASSECKISVSSKYKPIAEKGKTNQDDYALFVEKLGPDYNHTVLAEVPELQPYYTIYSIGDESIKTKTEGSYVDRLLLNKDIKFINENVRVEDYYYSDTAEDGGATFSADSKSKKYKGSFGKKRGTCSDMVALFENTGSFRFKTGVEYKLDVWTDDNVKWTNIEYPESSDGGPEMHYEKVKNTGLRSAKDPSKPEANAPTIQLMVGKPKLLDYARVFETGIKKGVIKLNIPNESENLGEEQKIDIKKHINGDIYFTLKDGTPKVYDLKTVEELEKNHFPSICVAVEDYSGLKRQLRLFFRVNDRSSEIKVLENSIK
jgi:hypothetical protein